MQRCIKGFFINYRYNKVVTYGGLIFSTQEGEYQLMKKDKFADLNTTKKSGTKIVVILAVIALCLAGVLCAVKMKIDSGSVTLDMSNVELSQEENNNG